MKKFEQLEGESLPRIITCPDCDKQLDVESFLSVHGPEGCYEFAKKLIKAADNDINCAISEEFEAAEQMFHE